MRFKSKPGDYASISVKQLGRAATQQTVTLSKECAEKVIFVVNRKISSDRPHYTEAHSRQGL